LWGEKISVSPTVARYAVASEKPPQLTDTIILADKVHAALVSVSDGSSVFAGCDAQGRPLRGNRHSHVFCESNKGLGCGAGGEITHITIYAPMGFESEDKKALKDLNRIWGGDDLGIRVILLGFGQPQDFGGLDLERGQSPLLALSRSWLSRTPFVPTRHPKVTRAGVLKRDASGLQIGSPEHELRRLLGLAGFPEPVTVEPVAGTWLGDREVPWRDFLCQRSNGEGRRAGRAGYGFRIEFPEQVQGPVAVGYGAHFGMGMFGEDEAENSREMHGVLRNRG
jgi:CRISPR-associated protein Csb2